jgi:hypothetical protein
VARDGNRRLPSPARLEAAQRRLPELEHMDTLHRQA